MSSTSIEITLPRRSQRIANRLFDRNALLTKQAGIQDSLTSLNRMTDFQLLPKQSFIVGLPTEILYKILKLLKKKDILTCRRVCLRFQDISTDILNFKFKVQLRIFCADQTTFYERSSKPLRDDNNDTSITSMISNIKSSKILLFTSFIVEEIIDEITEVKTLLSFYSLQIKSLQLKFRHHRPSGNVISEIQQFLHIVPNLQNLNLDFWFIDYSMAPQFSIQLPHLHSIIIKHNEKCSDPTMFLNSDSLVQQLLAAAPNLTNFENSQGNMLHYLNMLSRIDKLFLVKELCIGPTFIDIQAIEPTAIFLKLDKLQCDFNFSQLENTPTVWSRASILLTSLLESSKNCLKSLECSPPLGYLSKNGTLPLLRVLKSLHIIYSQNYKSVTAFPNETNLWICTPNLEIVRIEFEKCDLDNFYFQWNSKVQNSISSVHSLEILITSGDINKQFEKNAMQMNNMFCNLKKLKIESVVDVKFLVQTGKNIWKFMPELETIELNAFIDVDRRQNHLKMIRQIQSKIIAKRSDGWKLRIAHQTTLNRTRFKRINFTIDREFLK